MVVDGEAGWEVERESNGSTPVLLIKRVRAWAWCCLGLGIWTRSGLFVLCLDLEIITWIRLVCKVFKPKDLFCNF